MRWLDGIIDSTDMSLNTPGDSEGQGSLECCSPWSHKESDISERLNNKYEAVEQIVKSLPRSTRKRDGPGEQRGSSSRECRLSPLRLHTMTFSSSWVSEREDDRRRSGFYWVCLLYAGTMLDTADTTSLTVQHHLQFSITYSSASLTDLTCITYSSHRALCVC